MAEEEKTELPSAKKSKKPEKKAMCLKAWKWWGF